MVVAKEKFDCIWLQDKHDLNIILFWLALSVFGLSVAKKTASHLLNRKRVITRNPHEEPWFFFSHAFLQEKLFRAIHCLSQWAFSAQSYAWVCGEFSQNHHPVCVCVFSWFFFCFYSFFLFFNQVSIDRAIAALHPWETLQGFIIKKKKKKLGLFQFSFGSFLIDLKAACFVLISWSNFVSSYEVSAAVPITPWKWRWSCKQVLKVNKTMKRKKRSVDALCRAPGVTSVSLPCLTRLHGSSWVHWW